VVFPETFFFFLEIILDLQNPIASSQKKNKMFTDRLSLSKSLKPLMQDYTLKAWMGN
jgi:hypothetical protein